MSQYACTNRKLLLHKIAIKSLQYLTNYRGVPSFLVYARRDRYVRDRKIKTIYSTHHHPRIAKYKNGIKMQSNFRMYMFFEFVCIVIY